ncbi:Rpn family recombination-promoting nuclease/putative transposase [Ferrovum myxofaciens]|uniref:Rpn family recombination-promoting nuclease/putative transposase n=1 Tax=Ferrovum myxofaciens TaxID=416213 RepID=A0A9E6MYA6_9PROT|nr:Rpn family recombination-promoting nuclease/putative transposase [Ferrovum myxofaciens]QKE38159.1 MAG: Rpn family recombination-promoting nuclease/putative transposase [Ferrovum myxofaciens]QWY75885.1 MAG: Rpn family recombination-promoting nuclease/putative transposase [Ferrovum myxofaciens]QWY78617.1 MAG: Rpn family recombination-promoting nuclease/putative transposase [Ferrovum myxofaciens]
MSHEHDSSYKYLFSAPEFVRDLIMGFVPDEWLHSLDYTTLKKVDGNYITEDFRGRADDIVWRIKVGGDWVYLYILIEFQSTVDKYMALRMMVYMGLLYQDLIKQGMVLSDGRLPPVLPIVLYNGSQRWTAVTDVFDLIPSVPGLVEQFKPRAKYLLVDENAYTESELSSLKNMVAAVFRIEHPADPETIQVLLRLLEEWLVDRPDLRRMIARWIRATLMRKPEYRILLPEVDDLQELRIMLSERMKEWAHQYEAEGVQKGMQQGEALALQRLLTKRFGGITPEILTRIASASQEQIENWFDQAIDASGYAEVFGPTTH